MNEEQSEQRAEWTDLWTSTMLGSLGSLITIARSKASLGSLGSLMWRGWRVESGLKGSLGDSKASPARAREVDLVTAEPRSEPLPPRWTEEGGGGGSLIGGSYIHIVHEFFFHVLF